jgi:putative membrane protein
MEKLHPGATWLFRIRAYLVLFFVMIFVSGFVVQFLFILFFRGGGVGTSVLFGFIVYIVLIIVIGEIYARMSYSRWFYEFTPTNLKIEKGIIWKKYSNVPYERVQNVDIHRGIIARMSGFSSVAIQTAGLSYSRRGGGGAEGSIPAVSPDKAEKIRDFLMKKITKKSDGQGL